VQAKVKDIVSVMEKHFPLYLAEAWDNVGLQLGSLDKDAERIMIALDLDEEILEQALSKGVAMIITHHPLFFKPVKRIDLETAEGKMIKKLIQEDITVYSSHTNLDAAQQGLNQLLAESLKLEKIEPLGQDKEEELFKLVVYVPSTHVHELRQVINKAGAGHIGRYSDCSFRSLGRGTFKPEAGTNPHIGEAGRLEEVEEYRLETVAYKHEIPGIVNVMKEAHPYEEVAYDIYRLENQGKIFSLGRKGELKKAVNLRAYTDEVKKCLGVNTLRVVGNMNALIKTVAVVSGSGASLINRVTDSGIDLFITGDLKYHEAKNAQAMGLNIIDAGHQATEEIVTAYLCNLLAEESRARGFKADFIAAYSRPCFLDI
jgi:dinuclear metal center YbgI/SA1388 family protein